MWRCCSSPIKIAPHIKEELKVAVLASSNLLKKPIFFGLLQQALPCQYSTTEIKWYRNIIEQKTGDNLHTSPSPRRAFLSCQMTVQSCLRAITVVFASEKNAYLYRIHWALGMAEASTSRKRRLDIIWDQIWVAWCKAALTFSSPGFSCTLLSFTVHM